MPGWIERWLSASATLRAVSGAMAMVLLGLLGASGVARLTPVNETQRLPLADERLRLSTQLRHLPTRQALEQQRAQLAGEARPTTFSAVAFCARHEASFVSWRPEASGGGELVVDADWAKVPGLFATLSPFWLSVSGFTLAPVNGRLRLTLNLERVDAG